MMLDSATYEPTKENPNNAKTVFSMTVPKDMCNSTFARVCLAWNSKHTSIQQKLTLSSQIVAGALHGGAVALIFDICTSTALTVASKDGFWDTGHVSRTLNCTYLRPVPEGQKIWVESEVVHLGKRLATLKGSIKNEDGEFASFLLAQIWMIADWYGRGREVVLYLRPSESCCRLVGPLSVRLVGVWISLLYEYDEWLRIGSCLIDNDLGHVVQHSDCT